jgi:hypothetical protein
MYPITLHGNWPQGISLSTRLSIEDLISWARPQLASLYHQPGRTFYLTDKGSGARIKIKGAGFFNPGGVSFAGTKRTVVPVPEDPSPMPPLERAFKRDLIHVDPSDKAPHQLISVHSLSAPVGGMTLKTALNDQFIFGKLVSAKLPSNLPAAVYSYDTLRLDDETMGVSLSLSPANATANTIHDIYLDWTGTRLDPKSEEFFKSLLVRDSFSLSCAVDRMELIAFLGRIAGRLILQFSTDAGLYRFSGSPDNWNIMLAPETPLYFSDVDTSQPLDFIPEAQWGWEVLRNLISALHQWLYYFLPCLTYAESGYTSELLREPRYDFVGAMLQGFFFDSLASSIDRSTARFWSLFDPLLVKIGPTRAGLRTGEYLLGQEFSRPMFYFAVIAALSPLIQGSAFQRSFAGTNTSIQEVEAYLVRSIKDDSHRIHFAQYSAQEALDRLRPVQSL